MKSQMRWTKMVRYTPSNPRLPNQRKLVYTSSSQKVNRNSPITRAMPPPHKTNPRHGISGAPICPG